MLSQVRSLQRGRHLVSWVKLATPPTRLVIPTSEFRGRAPTKSGKYVAAKSGPRSISMHGETANSYLQLMKSLKPKPPNPTLVVSRFGAWERRATKALRAPATLRNSGARRGFRGVAGRRSRFEVWGVGTASHEIAPRFRYGRSATPRLSPRRASGRGISGFGRLGPWWCPWCRRTPLCRRGSGRPGGWRTSARFGQTPSGRPC